MLKAMNLEEFRDAVAAMPPDTLVKFSSVPDDGYPYSHRHPSNFGSYRGYYDHIALDSSHEPCSAGVLASRATEAIGATFEGYNGGRYEMDESTPLWIADYGNAGWVRPCGVRMEGDRAIIECVITE